MNYKVHTKNPKTKILVVDDSVEIVSIFSTVLRANGYEVMEAYTGMQAMEQAVIFRPDLVLLDVILPDINGIEVCRYIKKDTRLKNTFVALISGEAMSVNHKVDGFDTGADEYLTKPLALSELVARIRTIVRLQQTNAALRASEEHSRRLLDILPDAVALIKTNGRIQSLNPRAVAMLGYESFEPLQGLRFTKLVRQDQWRTVLHGMLALQTPDSMCNTTCILLRKDRRELPVEINATVVSNAKGDIGGVLLVARDLSERLWTERLIHFQKDYGVFLSSASKIQTAVSKMLETTMQLDDFQAGAVYVEEPKTGALVLESHQGISVQQSRKIARFEAGTPEKHSFRTGGKDGRFNNLFGTPENSIICAPVIHGKSPVALLLLASKHTVSFRIELAVKAIASQAGDAIARIRAEESLRASKQLLDKTLNSIRAAVIVADTLTDRIIECNRAATLVFGYSREELIGARTALIHINPVVWKHIHRQVRTELKINGAVEDFELIFKRKDGSVFPAEQSTAFIRNDAGRVISAVMVIRDIRERKRIEDQLRQFPNRIMEAQEAERERVARELHDGVNQLIASAKMRLQKVEDRLVSINPAAKELLGRAYNLMVQALEENRRIAHNLRPSDLDELGLPSACRNFCDQVSTRGNLVFSFEFTGFPKRLDPETELHLFRILQEAITNVEKHAKAKNVHIQLSTHENSVLLQIKDDGCGFNPHQQERKNQWEGMGLTNMRERAQLIGGVFDTTSSPNNGVTITVTAPFSHKHNRDEANHQTIPSNNIT